MRNDEKRLAPLVGWDAIGADDAEPIERPSYHGVPVREVERLPYPEPSAHLKRALAEMERARVQAREVTCTPSRGELFDAWRDDGPAGETPMPPIIAAIVFACIGTAIGIGVVWGVPAMLRIAGKLIAGL